MFDWRDYLLLAQALMLESTGSEAIYRAAASRAYYAAFHKSREEREIRAMFGRQGIHLAVIRALKERERWQSAGQDLERLWKYRLHADYDSDTDFAARHANIALELAVGVLSQIDSAPI